MDFTRILEEFESKIMESTTPVSESPNVGVPRKLKSTITSKIAGSLTKLPDVKKLVDLRSTPTGTVAFVRTIDGDAYEIEIRPSYKGKYFQDLRGVSEDMSNTPSRKNIMVRGANLVFSAVETQIQRIARQYNTTPKRVAEVAKESISRLISRAIDSRLGKFNITQTEKEWIVKEVVRLVSEFV